MGRPRSQRPHADEEWLMQCFLNAYAKLAADELRRRKRKAGKKKTKKK